VNINLTLIGQMIAFIGFVWFCMRFVWPPIIAAMKEREQKDAEAQAAAAPAPVTPQPAESVQQPQESFDPFASAQTPQQPAPVAPVQPTQQPIPQITEVVKTVEKEVIKEVEVPGKEGQFFKKRMRVTFYLGEGTFSIPAIDVRTSRNGLMVFVPVDDSSTSFIPKVGSQLEIHYRQNGTDHQHQVLYQGCHAEIEELSCMIMAFNKGDEDSGKE